MLLLTRCHDTWQYGHMTTTPTNATDTYHRLTFATHQRGFAATVLCGAPADHICRKDGACQFADVVASDRRFAEDAYAGPADVQVNTLPAPIVLTWTRGDEGIDVPSWVLA